MATAGVPQPDPQVSLDVSPNNVNKTGQAVFTATASAPPLFPIVVPFSMSGDAEQDVDYELDTFFNQIVIPAGHTSGSVTLTVITTKTQGKEEATMTLQPGCGYTLGKAKNGSNGTQASITINNKKAD